MDHCPRCGAELTKEDERTYCPRCGWERDNRIRVCPNCDSPQLNRLTNRGSSGDNDEDDKWGCGDCGGRFEEAAWREPRKHKVLSGMSKKLLEMDPEEAGV